MKWEVDKFEEEEEAEEVWDISSSEDMLISSYSWYSE